MGAREDVVAGGREQPEPVEPALHEWRIDPREYRRHEERRGRRHAYEHLDPRRTALVVVDMVPFFATRNPYVRGIVPNINALASALREARGTVTWVLPAVDAPSPWARGFYGRRVATAYATSGGEGSPGDRLWHELDAREDDLWAEKSAAGAFFPERCPLPDLLGDRGGLRRARARAAESRYFAACDRPGAPVVSARSGPAAGDDPIASRRL